MDGHTVVDVHLIKLIDANNAAIGKNHRTTFKSKSFLVSDDGGCQPCCARAFAACVHGNWGCFFSELQELTLSGARISQEEHVDVSSHARAIGKILARTSEQQASQRSLHILDDVLLAGTN